MEDGQHDERHKWVCEGGPSQAYCTRPRRGLLAMLTLERAASNCPTAGRTNLGREEKDTESIVHLASSRNLAIGPAFQDMARHIDTVLESSDMTCTKARRGEPAEHRGTHGPCKNSERFPTWELQYCPPLDGRPASAIHRGSPAETAQTPCHRHHLLNLKARSSLVQDSMNQQRKRRDTENFLHLAADI